MKRRYHLFLLFALLLLAIALVQLHRAAQPVLPANIADDIASKVSRELRLLEDEAVDVLENWPARKMSWFEMDDYSFFVFKHRQLIFWSDNRFIPAYTSVADSFEVRLIKSPGGDYLARKWRINEEEFLIGLIPLSKSYKITNRYLVPHLNSEIFPYGNISILDAGANIGAPVCSGNRCFFRVSFLAESLASNERIRTSAAILLFVSIILMISWGFQWLTTKKYKWGAATCWLIATIFLFGVRVLMLEFNFPGVLAPSDLFDPQHYASSDFNPSLGDLLLNVIVVFLSCLYLLTSYPAFGMVRKIRRRREWRILAGIVSLSGVLFAVLYTFVIVQSISNNSSISLDITQSLGYDYLRIVSLLILIFGWASAFVVAHICVRIFILSLSGKPLSMLFACVAGVGLFICINLATGQSFKSSLIIGILYMSVVYLLRLHKGFGRLSYLTFGYLFAALFCFALSTSYAINYFNERERLENLFRFADNFLIDRDYFGEYLLQDAASKISSDAFIQARMASPFLSKDAVRQKVRQIFLPSYFNKYDAEIFLYNSSGFPFDTRTYIGLSELIAVYDRDAARTDYENVYFISSPSADITQKYLVVIPVRRLSMISGYIVIELSLKRLIPQSVYPELLVDNRFQQYYQSPDLSYAVFSPRGLLFSSGQFNYERLFDIRWLGNPDLHSIGIQRDGYTHIAQEDRNNRVAIVSSVNPSFFFSLANFSFLLIVGLVVILLLILIQGITNYFRGEKLYFSARIQILLNLAFFIPLIVVSITTLSLTNRASQNQLNNEYQGKSRMFGDQLAPYLDDVLQGFGDADFENRLTDLAKFSNLDANVYDPFGKLLATSQPLIFENNLLSTSMNAAAFHRIHDGENVLIETEQIGTLHYYVSFAALRSPNSGRLIGIVGVPFFQSAYSVERAQISILANILNIFSGIFIVLLVLSFLVSEWLTFPLKFITRSLSRTSLTKTNQPLVWKADDEIGLMVKEYNLMLQKLSDSKGELERTQRERAWREIAQQVAHEIKNPLTPMKLTLQQLERAIQQGKSTEDKTRRAINTLLTQVDTLSEIASSFSAFARMPEPVIEDVALIALLRKTVNLHNQDGSVTFNEVPEIIVRGDEKLLGRIFSNIIINAQQAASTDRALIVTITVECFSDYCIVNIADTGKGMDSNDVPRVFLPHFSTKKTGSGLGLAIAKQGIEQMGGTIWFETSEDKGTTFHVELPLKK